MLALAPVVIFYLAAGRNFVFRPDPRRQAAAFLLGIAIASALAALGPGALSNYEPWLLALLAATIEKGALFGVLLVFLFTRPEKDTSALLGDATMAGLGFAAFENVSYSLAHGTPVLIRLLGATPMHAATMGVMGYFLAQSMSMSHWIRRVVYGLAALILPLAGHAAFDAAIFGGNGAVAAAFIAVLLTLTLDYLMAAARSVPPEEVLRGLELSYEDWRAIQRQGQFEQWLLLAGDGRTEPLFDFFRARSSVTPAAVLLAISFLYWPLREIIAGTFTTLKPDELAAFLSYLPAMAGMSLLLLGSFNTEYFRRRRIRIPTVIHATLSPATPPLSTEQEASEALTEVTYEVTLRGCFLRTVRALPVDGAFSCTFTFNNRRSPAVVARVVWDNHTNVRQEFGTLLVFERPTLGVVAFVLHYAGFRFLNGLRYSLRLPGFRRIRELFVRPETVIQTLRRFPAGTLLFREGDHGSNFFQIKRGTVGVYRTVGSEEVELARLGAGEIFGELAIAGAVLRNASARCLTECTLALADGNELDYLIHENPTFAAELLRLAARRFLSTGQSIHSNISQKDRQYRQERAVAAAGVALLLRGMGIVPDPQGRLRVDLSLAQLREAAGELLETEAELQQFLHIAISPSDGLLPANRKERTSLARKAVLLRARNRPQLRIRRHTSES